MPRSPKGPRLYLRKARIDSRTKKRIPDRYFIRDGSVEISTGYGVDRVVDAERFLADYILSKWAPPVGESDPQKVLIAEVLALYSKERGPKLKSDAATIKGFTKALLDWWGTAKLADIRTSSCESYVEHRTQQPIRHGETGRTVSAQTARRELEMLSAAVGYWDKEHHLTRRPDVALPRKAESNRDALTRHEAARLLKAARGYRLEAGGWKPLSDASKANRAHLVRFILLGLYTGSRSDVNKRLRWTTSLTDPWADVDAMIIYRSGRSERVAMNKLRPLVKLPRRLAAHMARWEKLDRKRGLATVLHHGGRQIGSVRTGFAGCVSDAGLAAEVTPHWLRHTAATWLMEKGVDVWAAAGYLGMSAQTLEKHYGHHRADHQGDARKAMR